MDTVKLMDRTDEKYTMSFKQLPILLKKLTAYYKLLQVKENIIPFYKTLYYDTADYKLYFEHHNGCLNRYKIRYRNYTDSDLGFLEIKFKSNKGRTIKQRIKQNQAPLLWNEACEKFIRKETPYQPQQLLPSLWVNYNRLTFVSSALNERITIDLNLEFKNNTSSKKMNNLVIVEIKRGARTESKSMKVLRELRVKPESLSKYCIGMAYMYPFIKKNNFKAQLNILKKIANDNSTKLASGF